MVPFSDKENQHADHCTENRKQDYKQQRHGLGQSATSMMDSSHLMGKKHITGCLDVRQIRLVTVGLDLPTSSPLLDPFEEEYEPVDGALDGFLKVINLLHLHPAHT